MGLSIANEVIEKHGDNIKMASEPNIGTTFWFELPLEQADADELMLLSERKSRQQALGEDQSITN